MAANIAKINGKVSAFTADEKAWWDELGKRVVKGAQRWEEAIIEANLNWSVLKKDMFVRNPLTNAVQKIEDKQAMFRDVDGQYLGVVGNKYEPVQNVQAFKFLDDLLEAENGAHYVSAGALGHGERIWTLAAVPLPMNVGGVEVAKNYLLFTTSHDGSEGLIAKLTTIFVVCQNTLSQALQGAGAFLKFRHTKSVHDRMHDAKRIWEGVSQDVYSLEKKLNLLAGHRLTKDNTVAILNRLFPVDKDASKAVLTRRDNVLAEILTLTENNVHNDATGFKGTSYNLLNAITDWTDHIRGTRITAGKKDLSVAQSRAESAIFGTGDDFKSKALQVMVEQAGGGTKSIIVPGTGLLDSVIANHAN